MKPKVIEQKQIEYESGVMITVKLIQLPNGNTEQRYFLYSVPEVSPCGGYGWKSLEHLIKRYEWMKSIGLAKAPIVETAPQVGASNPFFQ